MKGVFTAEHEHKVSSTETKIYPKGWSGDVPDDVAKAARKANKFQATAGEASGEPKKDDGKGKANA